MQEGKEIMGNSIMQRELRKRTWVMTIVHLFLTLIATAAASRLPLYLESGDIPRIIAVCLFALLVLIGFSYNIWVHLQLGRAGSAQKEWEPKREGSKIYRFLG